MARSLLLLIIILLLASNSYGETVWEYVDKKLEKKEFERWSLASWLYTKEKIALQDQWLSMNIHQGSILTEFYIDYTKSRFDRDTANNLNEEDTGITGELAAYVGFIGLVARAEEYGDLYKQKELSLSLRVIGSSHQSTHLSFVYGAREFKGSVDEDFTQNFYGADISLYLVSFLGLDGRYRYYMNEDNPAGTHAMRSDRTQWGLFLDISFFRLFTYQFEENLKLNNYSTPGLTELQIKGTGAGIRLYF